MVARMIRRAANGEHPIVIAGTTYGSAPAFLDMLGERNLPFVVQVRPSTVVQLNQPSHAQIAAARLLTRIGGWKKISATMPDGMKIRCSAAKLASVALSRGTGRLFAAQIGGISGVHRGTIIGLASFDAALTHLVHLVAHARG